MPGETRTTEKGGSDGGHVDVLDGLRGFAILLVMTLHVWQLSWLDIPQALHFPVPLDFLARAGFLGVEVFFFVSGFCLFWPHARHAWAGTPLPTWREYFTRRAAKILPSYYVSLLLIVLLFPWDRVPTGRLLWNLAAHLVFLHNWSYETYQSISGVTWSLAVEVQFYVLFPLLAARFRRVPWLAFLAMAATAQAYRFGVVRWGSPDNLPYTVQHNQVPAFLDLFGGGMLAAHLVGRLRCARGKSAASAAAALTPGRCAVLAGIAFAGILVLLRGIYDHPVTPNGLIDWQVRQRLPLSLLLIGFTVPAAQAVPAFRRAVANPALRFLAAISYNLYLWHQVLIFNLYQARIPAPATQDPHADPVWQWRYTLLAVAVSLAAGVLGTYLIERPFLRLARRRERTTTPDGTG